MRTTCDVRNVTKPWTLPALSVGELGSRQRVQDGVEHWTFWHQGMMWGIRLDYVEGCYGPLEGIRYPTTREAPADEDSDRPRDTAPDRAT